MLDVLKAPCYPNAFFSTMDHLRLALQKKAFGIGYFALKLQNIDIVDWVIS
jgi:hypothetical protein